MSFALVVVSTTDFVILFDHLVNYMPQYRNMHLREARQLKSGRTLRYLHAMYAPPDQTTQIVGAVSGPSIFWHYKIVRLATRTQITFLPGSHGAPKEEARLGARFVKEVMARVAEEQARTTVHHPKLLPGEFYLRRGTPGSDVSHLNCQLAMSSKVLHRSFVSYLKPWNLRLLRP